MRQKPGAGKAPAEQVIKDIRRVTREQYGAKEKILVVLSVYAARGRGNSSKPARIG